MAQYVRLWLPLRTQSEPFSWEAAALLLLSGPRFLIGTGSEVLLTLAGTPVSILKIVMPPPPSLT